MKRIAVAIVHGIDIYDPDFAKTPTKLLREEFRRALGPDGPDPRDALVVEPIHWAPDLQERQEILFGKMYGSSEASRRYFDKYVSDVIRRLNAGKTQAVVRLAASLLRPLGLGKLHWPTARWIMLHFIGDVVAYERCGSSANYDEIHRTFAAGLASLARRAGEDAPLCVMAHSFGTLLASDYFYDRQQETLGRDGFLSQAVKHSMGASPLARGETLAWMYTMGSPMALWSLRYDKAALDRPIEFPAPALAQHHPELDGEWVNIYEKDDIIAYPLRPLSDEYAQVVKEDREVRVKSLLSVTPLVHPFYWADRSVVAPIAETLARGWRQLNG